MLDSGLSIKEEECAAWQETLLVVLVVLTLLLLPSQLLAEDSLNLCKTARGVLLTNKPCDQANDTTEPPPADDLEGCCRELRNRLSRLQIWPITNSAHNAITRACPGSSRRACGLIVDFFQSSNFIEADRIEGDDVEFTDDYNCLRKKQDSYDECRVLKILKHGKLLAEDGETEITPRKTVPKKAQTKPIPLKKKVKESTPALPSKTGTTGKKVEEKPAATDKPEDGEEAALKDLKHCPVSIVKIAGEEYVRHCDGHLTKFEGE